MSTININEDFAKGAKLVKIELDGALYCLVVDDICGLHLFRLDSYSSLEERSILSYTQFREWKERYGSSNG